MQSDNELKKENTLDLTGLFKGNPSIDEQSKVIHTIQKAFDEICSANYEAINAARQATTLARDYKDRLESQSTVIIDLANTLNSVFIWLGSRKDDFIDDEDYKELMTNLAKFSLQLSMIKAKAGTQKQ